ncbi:MAG: peptidylprolyl isomerase, partial [Candidatus Cloacimonetes bacterium]|nr:peptidylprolyl isomerase [Candidatus Cloacimonadota bacterium]
MKTSVRYLICFLLALSLCIPSALGALRFARWQTSMGSITAEIYDHLMPITATNFINLTNSGFYNNLIFHRVVAGFVIQDGCPYGTGYGGPGYTIPDETSPYLFHNQAGILAMAKTAQPNSAGSQYYFTLGAYPHLDGIYAIFGKAIEGLDVIQEINQVPTNATGLPLTPVNIFSLSMLDLRIGTVTPTDTSTVVYDGGEPVMFIVEAYADNSPLTFAWYVDGVLQQGMNDFLFETGFSSAGEHTVQCIVASDDYAHTITWNIISTTSIQDDLMPPATLQAVSLAPSPFASSTTLNYRSAKAQKVLISVYDLRGRLICREECQALQG